MRQRSRVCERGRRDFADVLRHHGKGDVGCEVCKPAVASVLATVFGETAIIAQIPRSASVMALEATELVKVTREIFETEMKRWSPLADEVYRRDRASS